MHGNVEEGVIAALIAAISTLAAAIGAFAKSLIDRFKNANSGEMPTSWWSNEIRHIVHEELSIPIQELRQEIKSLNKDVSLLLDRQKRN